MTYLPFILFTVFTNAAAQMMLKQGMMTLGPVSGSGTMTALSVITMILKVVFHPWVFFGLCTFVISMASHLYVLSKVELSFAYPFLSLAYVAVAVAAWWLFSEDLNAWRIAGIGFICVGTVMIAQGGDAQSRNPDRTANTLTHKNHAQVAHSPASPAPATDQ
ncbi:MAG: transporter [Pseudomonadota bacterium]